MTLTWGQIDAARELEISKWDWAHQWPWVAEGGPFTRCARCDVVSNVLSKDTRCRGDTPEQAQAHMDLFQ